MILVHLFRSSKACLYEAGCWTMGILQSVHPVEVLGGWGLLIKTPTQGITLKLTRQFLREAGRS